MAAKAWMLGAICAFILAISLAAGDIHISHTYYTEGGDASETMDIHNLDYSNQVSIYRDSLFATAEAALSDIDEKGIFSSRIITRGEGGTFGARLNAEVEKEFKYGRSLATGFMASDKTNIDYTLSEGTTNALYFTSGGSVSEDVFVKNVNYVNDARIYPHALYGNADADLLEGTGLLSDNILVDSRDGLFGTGIFTTAEKEIEVEKSFAAGDMTHPNSEVTYLFNHGVADAGYFNPRTHVEESISTDSAEYQAMIKNSVDELHSKGHGKVTEDDTSGFSHTINMLYGGKNCKIDATLSTGSEVYGSRTDLPVGYVWNTFVDSDGSSAKDMIVTQAVNGNRDIDFIISGKADGLPDKCAGPMHLSPLGFIGISKELYMSYEITI